MISQGVVGPFKDFKIAYHDNVQSHNQQQMYMQVNSKRHKYKAIPEFSKVYPDVYKWWCLGAEPPAKDYAMELGRQIANDFKEAPAWISEATSMTNDQ